MSGLREQKKARTRLAIQEVALRLVAAQGYDATTCEQIAAGAHVAPATLFRYFPTKEDILLQDAYDPMIADAVRRRPASESPLTAVRRALATTLDTVSPSEWEHVRQRTALILSVPALRGRSREQYDSLVGHLARALADRARTDPEDLAVQVPAVVCAAALGLAVERWAREGGALKVHVDEALVALGSTVRRVR